jgi:hypothetical protein
MARLSDFQTPVVVDAPIRVDEKLMARVAKASGSAVDWKNGRVPAKPGTDDMDLLQRYGRDNASDEPVESDSDEEPDEAADAFKSFVRLFRNDAAFKAIATRQRPAAVDRGAATVISARKEVTHSSGYLTDAAFIAKHLDPNMLCVEAENALHDISYKRQADDAARGYWSGLFFFLKSQPKGSRICDIENQVCLSTLLQRTVGGMQGVFGV